MKDEEIIAKWKELDSGKIEHVYRSLRSYERDINDYLVNCVAELCNVTVDGMFSQGQLSHNAHARWLYWYAQRRMTNGSFEEIARQSNFFGHKFTSRAIQSATSKMAIMIDKEPIWRKRWIIVKNIISLREKAETEAKADNTIVIKVPKELRDLINIEIKEKQ